MANPINSLNQVIYQLPAVAQLNNATNYSPVAAAQQAQEQEKSNYKKAAQQVSSLLATEKSGKLNGKAKEKIKNQSSAKSKKEEQASEKSGQNLINKVV